MPLSLQAFGDKVVNADALQAADRNVKMMIKKAIDSTKDDMFHEDLYKFLMDHKLDDYLLNLDTVHVETFLQGASDPLKLYE